VLTIGCTSASILGDNPLLICNGLNNITISPIFNKNLVIPLVDYQQSHSPIDFQKQLLREFDITRKLWSQASHVIFGLKSSNYRHLNESAHSIDNKDRIAGVYLSYASILDEISD